MTLIIFLVNKIKYGSNCILSTYDCVTVISFCKPRWCYTYQFNKGAYPLTAHDQDKTVGRQIVICICEQQGHRVLGTNIVVICVCAQQGHRVLGANIVNHNISINTSSIQFHGVINVTLEFCTCVHHFYFFLVLLLDAIFSMSIKFQVLDTITLSKNSKRYKL